MISPHSAAYVSEMRKVSSESDSIVGFGEEGNATRHYTEVRFQLKGCHWQLATTSMLATGQTVLSSTSRYLNDVSTNKGHIIWLTKYSTQVK